MKPLDILLVLLLAWGAYSGFKSGFIMEIFSLFSFTIAKIISTKLLHLFKYLYKGQVGITSSYIGLAVCFAIILLIMFILGRIFTSKLHHNKPVLGRVDKSIGLLVGTGKWVFYISAFIRLADLFNVHLPESYITNTLLHPIIKAIPPSFIF